MYFRCQIFIIVAIVYSSYGALADESDNCDCDVLQIESNGLIGNQNFTKQIGTLNGKPYYFSSKWYMISWKTGNRVYPYWSIDKYNAIYNEFESKQNFTVRKIFTFEDMCNPKLYTPSTLNIDFIQWHTQLNVCAVK